MHHGYAPELYSYIPHLRATVETFQSVFTAHVNNTHSIISEHYHRNCALFTYLSPRDSINYCDSKSLCAVRALSVALIAPLSTFQLYKRCLITLLPRIDRIDFSLCIVYVDSWLESLSAWSSWKRERGAPKINIKVEKRNQNL